MTRTLNIPAHTRSRPRLYTPEVKVTCDCVLDELKAEREARRRTCQRIINLRIGRMVRELEAMVLGEAE